MYFKEHGIKYKVSALPERILKNREIMYVCMYNFSLGQNTGLLAGSVASKPGTK